MNYRHAFHAGNFADVLKHAVLARILVHLGAKDAAFRVIDTHAGLGLYDLGGDAAQRTGEWRDGIGRFGEPLPEPLAGFMAPYLGCVAAARALHGPSAYPGSPWITAHLARAQDKILLVEKHTADVTTLAQAVAGDRRAKVIALDGWTAVKAWVPPPEKRGLVIIDPPFEEPGEFDRILRAITTVNRKWRGGLQLVWYPVKDRAETDAFLAQARLGGIEKLYAVELQRDAVMEGRPLAATGLLLVNPPWTLPDEINAALPLLAKRLKAGPGAGWRAGWLTGQDEGRP